MHTSSEIYIPPAYFEIDMEGSPNGYRPVITIEQAPHHPTVAGDLLETHRSGVRGELLDHHDVDGNSISEAQLAGMFEEDDKPRLMAYTGWFDPTTSDTKLILRAAFDIDTIGVLNMWCGNDLVYYGRQDIPPEERTAITKLHALHIAEGFRRQRIGSHILAYALQIMQEHCDPNNDAEMYLNVVTENENARRFYDSLGIAPTGHTMVVELPSGSRVATEHRQARISAVLERLAETGVLPQTVYPNS